MSFGRFGRVGYVAEAKVAEFAKSLEEGKLLGTRCTACGILEYPPRADCKNCLSSAVEWVELRDGCRLITYTEVHFAPPSFRDDVPYILGLAQLVDGPLVFAPLSRDVAVKDVRIGMELRLVPVTAGVRVFYELRRPEERGPLP